MLSYVRPQASNPYPVGSIYQTANPDFDPAVAFGGVWIRIKGRVLVGVDETDPDLAAAAAVGGEKEHTLTTTEMPAHTHTVPYITPGGSSGGVGYTTGTYQPQSWHKTLATGGDQPHNNMPPYYTVYIWQRTA